MIKSIYPNYDWKPWLFSRVPRLFWYDINNQKEYLKWIAKNLNIQTLEDWYKISSIDIVNNKGRGLINYYKGSFFKLLKTVYPDYNWKPWLFNNSPKSYWNKNDSVNTYIKWLENQLEIKALDDWYNVSAKDITKYFQGNTLLNKYGGLKAFLLHYYPNHKWNLELL
jgi:hypothetical protein